MTTAAALTDTDARELCERVRDALDAAGLPAPENLREHTVTGLTTGYCATIPCFSVKALDARGVRDWEYLARVATGFSSDALLVFVAVDGDTAGITYEERETPGELDETITLRLARDPDALHGRIREALTPLGLDVRAIRTASASMHDTTVTYDIICAA